MSNLAIVTTSTLPTGEKIPLFIVNIAIAERSATCDFGNVQDGDCSWFTAVNCVFAIVVRLAENENQIDVALSVIDMLVEREFDQE